MKKTNLFFIVIIILLSNSCAWFDESENQKIVDDYEVGWNDLVANRSITKAIKDCDGCYEVVINSYVYAVGHNEKYIIAKQLDNSKTETNYFIIDIEKNKIDSKKGILGPFNKTVFEKNRMDLKIEKLKFDLNYTQKP